MKRTAALLTIGAALALAGQAQADAVALPSALPSVYGQSTQPIIFNNGAPADEGWVQSDPVVHLVFWGPTWMHDSTGIVTAELALFRELPGTTYNALLGQYGVHNDVRLAGSFFDAVAPPQRSPLTLTEVIHEASRARRLHHWSTGPQDQWIILPQLGTNMRNFTNECGEHDLAWLSRNGHWRAAGWVFGTPAQRWRRHRLYNVILVPPFDDPTLHNCVDDYSTDNGTREPASLAAATTSLTSHEYAEAATDPPMWSGWSSGEVNGPLEIADLCAWYSGTPAGMTVNVSYLWSNALGDRTNGCTL